jgi:hypothetical protein
LCQPNFVHITEPPNGGGFNITTGDGDYRVVNIRGEA